jgi:hypothetical protein
MNKWLTGLALLLCLGFETAAADTPGLTAWNEPSGPFTKTEATEGPWKITCPYAEGLSLPARALVSGQLEGRAEYMMHRRPIQEGEAEGWISFQTGLTSDGMNTVLGHLNSVVLIRSTYYKGAAHPMSYMEGMTFDEKGHQITTKELLAAAGYSNLSVKELTSRLEQQAEERGVHLFQADWRIFRELPKESYVGSDGHVYLIFQLYEVAPYASGFVSVDMGSIAVPE